MLRIEGQSTARFCDGASRRDFLQVGALGLGGLALPQLLQAEAAQGVRHSHKAVIMIYLTGGPPHQDMFDLKPDAPKEVRGEFKPIATNVPGIRIGEHFTRLAKLMDKCAIIRSLTGSDGRHSSFQCVTGRRFATRPAGGWPEVGSILSRVAGPVNENVPPAFDLSMHMAHLPYNLPGAGFLGAGHRPFKPTGQGQEDLKLNGVSPVRLGGRRSLLDSFDTFRRDVDARNVAGLDAFTQQAFGVLTSSKLAEALDLSREDPKVRASYGKDDPHCLPYSSKGYQAHMSKFLLARRLAEAGARCVTVAFADYDWHGSCFAHGKKVHPLLDQGLSALITDLHQRGLDKDVSVVVWGEFGRTPKINERAGRDHWNKVCAALLAGGGMRTGQVIGATDKTASEPTDRPVQFEDVHATLYHNLGIDPHKTTVDDLSGRPRYLLGQGEVIRELV
tara:strand:+ start:160 stop:1500 length:1341 start_codon:yes stop_codon:yes gene_type:complete